MEGINYMLKRTGKPLPDYTLTKGPGNLARALGISKIHTGSNVFSEEIFIEDDGLRYKKNEIVITHRIGVDYAGTDALLPYRFIVKGNPYVSAKKS
jgi:DNA-3-methyladenine glycosylase